MKSGPEKVCRETCAHCQWQGMPEECADCPAKMVYDCIDEHNYKVYYTEYANLGRNFKERCNLREAKYYKYHGRRR